MNKNCRNCGIPLNDENTHRYARENYVYKCIPCVREEKRAWAKARREKNPTHSAESSLYYSEKMRQENPIKHSSQHMRNSASGRAKRIGLEFNIDTDYIISICPTYCPVFGYKLRYGSRKRGRDSPSLDRIIPENGYVKGNVQVVSFLANTMKNEASFEEMYLFAEWVQKRTRR